MAKFKMDEKDLSILKELEVDCKKSLKEISKGLKMSMTSVFERIKKMEKNNVIVGYKAILNKDKLDKSSTAFAFIKLSPGAGSGKHDIRDIGKKIGNIKGVSEVFIVNGHWDIMVKIRASNMDEVAGISLNELRKINGIQNLETLHSWETVKENFDLL